MAEFIWKDRSQQEYAYSFGMRTECLEMIREAPTVALDIGCGIGGVGYALRRLYPGCQLWGCELDAVAAQQARQHFDHVLQQDVEQADFAALGLAQPFDLVCLFDVLEHLFNPWQLLHSLLRHLAPAAQVLVSLPNVSNIPLLYDALHGHWHYRRIGLLDFTHLRFFSDFDARKMFYQTGYRVLDHRMNLMAQGASIYERFKDAAFPAELKLGDMTFSVDSAAHLRRLCADQNLYLITPHHGQLANDEERELASAAYPQVYAFGAD